MAAVERGHYANSWREVWERVSRGRCLIWLQRGVQRGEMELETEQQEWSWAERGEEWCRQHCVKEWRHGNYVPGLRLGS